MSPARDPLDSTYYGAASSSARSMADLCTDAFLLLFFIQEGKDPGQPDQLRKEIALLFQDLDKRGKKYGYSEEDIKAARYALCALLDETILNSRWSYKEQWAERPLQLEYFGEHMAGERYFELLDRIRKKGDRKADLLEVFSIVLILGFQGKYKMRGADELDNLIRETVGEVHNFRGGGPRGLSPHWQIPSEPVERPAPAIPRWVWITGLSSVGLVLVLFIVFKLLLGSGISEAVSRIVM
jgi:type VI secretion system protein ImpK